MCRTDLTLGRSPVTVRLLAFAASLRQASLNRRLIQAAAGLARGAGAAVDLADFSEFDMPLFNADIQEREGLPPGTRELHRRLERVDGLLLASPEYNSSMPGTLKNAIDWVSRIRPVPLRGKSAFLMAASSGRIGGVRGLWQLRIPLEALGVLVYPDMFTLPHGAEAFDAGGTLKDAPTRERLEKQVTGYLRIAAALARASG
jgi:chromate reductase